jgi:hypothetical protein
MGLEHIVTKYNVAASPQYGVNDQTDVFFVGENGQLYVKWVVGGGFWDGPVGLGPVGIFPAGASVAASPQYGVNNQTDVFAVGNNGQLHVFWVSGGGNWAGPVGLGPTGAFPPGARVTASPQYGVNNQTDVFVVGNNGQLHVFWVSGGGNWAGPVGLGPTGVFPAGAAVAASPQYGVANQTDVFAIGNNGQLHVFWVSGGGNWNGPVGLGAAGIAPAGAPVEASPQYGIPNQTDVFTVGINGQIHVAWVVGGGNWNGPLGLGAGGVFPAGASLAASPQYGVANQTDVFAIGNNGQLHVLWVVGAGNWNGPVGLGGADIFPAGTGIAASAQYGIANQTDVFAIGHNGLLHVAWVLGGGNWAGPIGLMAPPAIAVQFSDNFHSVVVDGQRFTPNGDVTLDYQIEAEGAPSTTTSGSTGVRADASGAFSTRIDVTIVGPTRVDVRATDAASGRTASGADQSSTSESASVR